MEQQEPDIVFPRPSLQKHEHAKTAASDGTHLREFKNNDPGICLRGDGFAQLISGFSLYDSALAPNDGYFTYICNGYIQHDFLPAFGSSKHCPACTTARPIPSLYFVQDESLLSGQQWNS